VHELDNQRRRGVPSSLPQYWKRNTLVLEPDGRQRFGQQSP